MRGEPDAEADSDKSPFKEDNIVQTAPFVERKNTKVMRNGTLIGSKKQGVVESRAAPALICPSGIRILAGGG
jgi:hypothetical protein